MHQSVYRVELVNFVHLWKVLSGLHHGIMRMQELLEQEAENRKAIEDIIEEERRKVDAKTPITEEVSLRSKRGFVSFA